ncbi:SDR family NAD(P)-dependent oxidoreductase [Yersinia enterocolitica]|nr:SDR family oxidoreductase [Yersinia enterocolitica]EKN6001429.1 SDR family NAD(P)-dependent oxidoreductase [Yersinia enterocolitica]EKN6017337.1 SDR family NAD(P)-dependent oxidoreductase [Yersinia enterocolitica]EKN6038540.1 SDR family NAD(P)-dependent oxidoreductase [Yersinia enterocolitica]EKN6347955.1 SDR family NAD(P)-dependent oxidoreductase [Yersinia enterocolitica]
MWPSNMCIAITGCNGVVGSTLENILIELNYSVFKLKRTEYQLGTKLSDLVRLFDENKISVLIHCAANTDVDFCELYPDIAYSDNYILTEFLSRACEINKIKLVYISSTGVYGNEKHDPYREFDKVNPTTSHHRSKYLGEQSITNIVTNYLIIRTGWIFGGDWSLPKNFVANRIREAKKSKGKINSDISQYGNPTYAYDLCLQILKLIEINVCGVFNCVNQGVASRYEYVSEIIKLSDLLVAVIPVDGSAFARIAKVSNNESAFNYKLNEYDIDIMPHWKDSLKNYMEIIRNEI